MAIARITGQGLTFIALLVVLLWACALGERATVNRANADAADALRAMRVLRMKARGTPVATPVRPPTRRSHPELG